MPLSSFSATDRFEAVANEEYEVAIAAATEAGVPPPGGGISTAFASVDPFIQVDPSFPNASQYTIQFSDGVGNGIQPVDEPGSFAILGIGLPALLAFARRRRLG